MTTAVHEITVEAKPEQVFGLLADVANWPRLFPPTVHVDWLEGGATWERVRIWATANGRLRSWTSRRTLDPAARRITFHQEVSPHPVAEMSGAWEVDELSGGRSLVRLHHEFRAVDDDPADLARIAQAVDTNSRTELAALCEGLEAAVSTEVSFSFTDSVRIGGTARAVFDFVNQADLWPDRLPHVAAVHLLEPELGLQSLTMDTRGPDGSVHTTHSYRVCLSPTVIAYKQTVLPLALALHTGRWTFEQDGPEVVASSEHSVVLNAGALPPGLDLPEARAVVRQMLGGNSLATLSRAKKHVEGR